MATSYPLHPIAAERLQKLRDRLESEFGNTDSERKIVNAAIYGATADQLVGVLEKFARDRRSYNDRHEGQPGAEQRAVAGR